ncbi:MAG: HAMP domain-containing histidine kinase [Treponemataceae bacterium]|nr:HAMP domain-containing histidine kinase [Treponemataceae bacterium]
MVKISFATRLSVRFMFLLTIAVMLISCFFMLFVNSLVKGTRTRELANAENTVYTALSSQMDKSRAASSQEERLSISGIPYYLTYISYYYDTKAVIATNDPFLPLLEDTEGKALRYIEKDFFFDGDLDIFYYADTHQFEGEDLVIAVAMNMDNDSTAVFFEKLPPALLLMTLPVLLVSFFVSFLITKNTINPVVRITKAAKTMTTEKLEDFLPLTGRDDEIDQLSHTFNELFLRIKADFDRERQFSSDVSHELNTPLTVISGQTNLLLRWGKDDPEQLEKSLAAIKDEAKSMHTIIENLLQISRIESGRIKPDISEVNIGQLFCRVISEFKTIAPEAQIKISEAPREKEVTTLSTDPEMLHQILTILVSNSVKFSGGKCNITLQAEKRDGRIMIRETDDGPGIPEEALPHIFERFYRADQAHTRSTGGCGLGLSIAKTLTSALNAEICAEKNEGHGAVFTISLME